MDQSNPKNFPEDFTLENGSYTCRCCLCSGAFIGYKRRVVCKECETNAQKVHQEFIDKEIVKALDWVKEIRMQSVQSGSSRLWELTPNNLVASETVLKLYKQRLLEDQ